jgi:hypothetical protein
MGRNLTPAYLAPTSIIDKRLAEARDRAAKTAAPEAGSKPANPEGTYTRLDHPDETPIGHA